MTLLVADTAPTLYFGTRRCFKSVQAARVGALVAWAAQRSGDRITALRGSRSEAPRPPAGSARGALRVLDALVRWYTAPPPDDAGLDFALQTASRVGKPGSRIVALLDPRSVDAVADPRWTALAAHHDAIAVLLVDPLELAPPRAQVAFEAEASRIELDLSDSSTLKRWQELFGEHHEKARERLQRLGWRVLVLRTDDTPQTVLATLLPHRREAA